jgi:hypothetical protein
MTNNVHTVAQFQQVVSELIEIIISYLDRDQLLEYLSMYVYLGSTNTWRIFGNAQARENNTTLSLPGEGGNSVGS